MLTPEMLLQGLMVDDKATLSTDQNSELWEHYKKIKLFVSSVKAMLVMRVWRT